MASLLWASRWPNPVFRGMLSALLMLCWAPIQADTPPLSSFTAEYRLDRDGLPFASMVTRFDQGNRSYRFEARVRTDQALGLIGKALMIFRNANLTETSEGTWVTRRYRPDGYSYRREGGDGRVLTIAFDWRAGRAKIESENQPWSMKIPKGTQDKLTVLLALRQDLSQGAKDPTYSVADGGRLKRYGYRYQGQEALTTLAGRWNVIRLARSKDGAATDYRLWLAPKLEYLPILVERTEDGSVYRMELVRVDMGN